VKPDEAFAANLRHERERRRQNRKAMAECVGLSKNCIARYERLERVPDINAACEIADYLGVSLDLLCGRGEK
jgi:transcriptional regulator with XRE-family HTH domain